MMLLNQIFEKLSPPSEILTLPISHLFSVRALERVVENGALEPMHCKVFGCNLLYFSYGGVFHRYGQEPTNEVAQLPVAILFKPSLLSRIEYFFPYDTGAAKKGRYNSWSNELSQWDKYRVFSNGGYETPSKLVYYIYGSNDQYLKGEVLLESQLEDFSLLEPLVNLMFFLRDDLTPYGTDYRQRVIECQTTQKIDLREAFHDVIWIGLPRSKFLLYDKFCKLSYPICPPESCFYHWRPGQRPSELASMLESEAYKIVLRYISLELGGKESAGI